MKSPFFPLLATVLLTAAAGCSSLKTDPTESDLVFTDLASVWDEAMPLGNATVGALVWQKEDHLRLSLDRIDLWDLRPAETHIGDHFSFEWVKEHIKSGDYAPVLEKFDRPANKYPAPSKIPGAGLEINTADWGAVKASRLFLRNALCEVLWENGTRLQTFIPAEGSVGWLVFDHAPASLDIQLVPPEYQSADPGQSGDLGASSLQLLGYEQGPVQKEGNTITYHQCGYGDFFYDVAIGWKRTGNRLACAWSVTSSRSGKEAVKEVEEALNQGFRKAYKGHTAYWNAFWNESVVEVPDTLIQHQYDKEIYKFGSTARSDSYPISLQSVWTADNGKLPPWKGDYHHDLNTQLSYWPAYSGNRLQEGLGYLNTLWSQRDAYREFTRKYFGKDGIAVPGVCTLDGHAMGSNWVMYGFSATTSAWLAQHFYLHWKYSADAAFLKDRAYPFLKEVALFLEQQTIVRPDGVRTFEYSASPEINNNRIDAWFSNITNYDLALTRFAFSAASEMADSLGLADEAKHWKSLFGQLPYYALDEDGGLSIAPDYPYSHSHRHFSHALAIHPLGLLDAGHGHEEKRIIDATLANLHRHGSTWWTGYSFSWLANLEARAGHGEEAAEALRTFASCFCLRNSFHANGDQTKSGKSRYTYRPFTLEGNFAYAAGLQEMLLQSQDGIIRVFPAIPSNWKDVKFSRLRAIGAFLVSAGMKGGEITSLTVFSEKGGRLRILSPKDGQLIEKETVPGETIQII